MNRETIDWNMHEFHYLQKNADWYWALGIISIAAAIAAIYFNNILFAIIILLGAFALGMHGNVEPKVLSYKLSRRGATIEDTLYPFDTLDSFWVEEHDHKPHRILVKSRKLLMPYIIMPLSPDVDPDEIRHFLLDHGLPEEELHEGVVRQIFEHLGF
jgi:hypothetical protein